MALWRQHCTAESPVFPFLELVEIRTAAARPVAGSRISAMRASSCR